MHQAAEYRSATAGYTDRNTLQSHEQAQVAGIEAGAGVHRLERTGGAEHRRSPADVVVDRHDEHAE